MSRRGPSWKPSASSAGPSGEVIADSPSTFSRATRLMAPGAHVVDERGQRRLDPRVPGGDERLQGAPAPLQVDDRVPAHEHHVGAGHARRPAPPAALVFVARALGPRQRRPVGLGRVDGGEHQRRRVPAPGHRRPAAARAQPLDRPRQRELGAAQPLQEVAAAGHAQRLELGELGVDAEKPPGMPSARTCSRVTIP